MRLTKPIFWAEFSLVVMTASIIYWYLFASSNNGCQMTFMMEPPKFILVPIDDDIKNYPQSKLYSKSESSKYKLFMYSELGFPSPIDISRDLKDSMPVLFIPGNAGSYQQVRSLASTSIKSQLTSLKALKFIFYTIDFRGQLSGLSGELIEDQIQFVQLSLKQITRMHSKNSDGVIIVGHSVGGLIAKALFAVPNFDTKSVPLIINLASPLNKPFLNIDSKMQAIYDRTKDFWSEKPIDFNTISISISGGRPDRLVPMHLTMDTEYDFSLTTGSINGVWLETDHVSITWCKELMHRIASLLSALMDKNQTRLIQNRYSTIAIVEKELLTRNDKAFSLNQISISSQLEILPEPVKMIELNDSISIARTELSNNMILLNFTHTDPQDFIVVIEHIESLKGKEVYGCKGIGKQPESNQLHCVERRNILNLSKSIPSRRYEPKRTAIVVSLQSADYLIFDFKSDKNRAHKLPESIIVQSFGTNDNTQIRLPDISEILLGEIFPSSDSYSLPVMKKSFSYNQYKVTNLNTMNRFMTMFLKLEQCTDDDGDSKLGVALLYKDGYLNRAFHLNPPPVTKRDPRIAIKFSTDLLSITTSSENEVTLELFTNGRCVNKIWFEFDYWDYVFDFVQVHLDKILQVSCLLVTIMLYVRTRAIVCGHEMSWKDLSLELIGSLMFVALLRFHSSDQMASVVRSFRENIHDLPMTILFSLTLLISSCGIIATLKHLFNCTIDLAIIVNRVQVNTRKVMSHTSSGSESNHQNGISDRKNSNHSFTLRRIQSQTLDYDWAIIGFASALGVIFSYVFLDICCIFLLIKFAVLINTAKEAISHREQVQGSDDMDTLPEIQALRYENVHNWSINLGVICTISLISNIPSILLRLNRINNNGYNGYGMISDFPSFSVFVYATASLVMIKLNHQKILTDYLDTIQPVKCTHLGDWRHGFYRMIIKIFTLWHALSISDCFSVSANLLLLFAATSSYQYLTQLSRPQVSIEKNNR